MPPHEPITTEGGALAKGTTLRDSVVRGRMRARIVDARATPLDVPLSAPFGIAGGVQARVENVLVEVRLEDGSVGLGEAAPLPAYNGETQAAALAALGDFLPTLVGKDAARLRPIADAARAMELGSARCAAETAVLDAFLRSRGTSMWDHFGGADETLETDVTLPTGAAAEEARAWAARGFRVLKIKVGAASPDEDAARVVEVARAAPSCRLTLDGNAGLDLVGATRLLDLLDRAGVAIALFEQPLAKDDLAGLSHLRARVRVCADESVVEPADCLTLARAGAADVVNVKIMKAGLVAAHDTILAAKAAGLGLMVGGMVESKVAMSASFCLAAGIGGFTWVDLDTPLFFAREITTGGFSSRGPRLGAEGCDLGHGVRVV